MKKNIAVILSGCGYLDGAEITESISLLISLSTQDCDYQVFAPNKELVSIEHNSIKESGYNKNCLEEAARISRGKVLPLSELKPENFDGLALPGGFGVAKNLSTWAQKASACEVDKNFERIVSDFNSQSKPILAICIAPAVVAKILGKNRPHLTIGNDANTKKEITNTGAEHIDCAVTDYVTDREQKIITTPAYMYDSAKPSEVFEGVSKATKEFLGMC